MCQDCINRLRFQVNIYIHADLYDVNKNVHEPNEMCAFCHSVHTLTMTGFGRVSPAQTELSGWPNKQPRAVLRDSSFRFEEEPRQKAQAMSERLLLNGFPEKSEEMTAAQKA